VTSSKLRTRPFLTKTNISPLRTRLPQELSGLSVADALESLSGAIRPSEAQMIHKTLRYSVKPESVENVKQAVQELVDAVGKNEPGILRYEAYVEHDGVSFVHTMTFKDEESNTIHRTADHTDRFVEALYPSCKSLPVYSDLTLLKSANEDA
jgi:quinol monooxygenase YgiN